MSAASLSGIHKRFGAVHAVRGARLEVREREIHALVGENGAGKSTLMRVCAGQLRADGGELAIFGAPVPRGYDARGAIARGVGMVHQHFLLADALTVAENVVLGREPRRAFFFDRARAEREVAALGERHGLRVEPSRRTGELSVGEAQRVEILKALYRGARLLILDEPTAVLSPPEIAELWRVLRSLREAGASVVVVTHKLAEVMEVSERVTVMRAGETVLEVETAKTSADALARAIVGGEPPTDSSEAATAPAAKGPIAALTVRDLAVDGPTAQSSLRGLSFDVRAGEILGVAGVEGNGQAALCDAIAGLARPRQGHVLLGARDVTRASVRERADAGLAHVPADRHARALVLEMSVAENLVLGRQREFSRFGVVSRGSVDAFARARLDEFDVRPRDPALPVAALSGGNQQKLVMARELSREYGVLLVAQPTRGVDLGATARIHAALRRARAEGKAILLVSSELPELLSLCDRLLVLFGGRVVGELDGEAARSRLGQERLGRLMTGAVEAAP